MAVTLEKKYPRKRIGSFIGYPARWKRALTQLMRNYGKKMVGTAFQRSRPPQSRLHLTPMRSLELTLAALDWIDP